MPPLRAPRFLPERQTSPLLDGTRFPYRSSRGANPPRRTEGTEGARSERTFRGSSFPGRRFLASVQEVPVSLTHRTCDYSLASDAADRSPSRIKLPYRFAARVLERILRWKRRAQSFVVIVFYLNSRNRVANYLVPGRRATARGGHEVIGVRPTRSLTLLSNLLELRSYCRACGCADSELLLPTEFLDRVGVLNLPHVILFP